MDSHPRRADAERHRENTGVGELLKKPASGSGRHGGVTLRWRGIPYGVFGRDGFVGTGLRACPDVLGRHHPVADRPSVSVRDRDLRGQSRGGENNPQRVVLLQNQPPHPLVGAVEKRLLTRNWPKPSFRRTPESRAEENGDTPVFHPPLTGWNTEEIKKTKAKSLDSGMRRNGRLKNEEHNYLSALGGALLDIISHWGAFSTTYWRRELC